MASLGPMVPMHNILWPWVQNQGQSMQWTRFWRGTTLSRKFHRSWALHIIWVPRYFLCVICPCIYQPSLVIDWVAFGAFFPSNYPRTFSICIHFLKYSSSVFFFCKSWGFFSIKIYKNKIPVNICHYLFAIQIKRQTDQSLDPFCLQLYLRFISSCERDMGDVGELVQLHHQLLLHNRHLLQSPQLHSTCLWRHWLPGESYRDNVMQKIRSFLFSVTLSHSPCFK